MRIRLRDRSRDYNNRDVIDAIAKEVELDYEGILANHYTVYYYGYDRNAKKTVQYICIPRENVLSTRVMDATKPRYSMKTFKENLEQKNQKTEETQEA